MEAEVVAARDATARMARRRIGGEAADRIIIFLVGEVCEMERENHLKI
jgi:hypothetical protein